MLDGAIAMLKIILENMIVHEDRIRKNLYMTKGLIVSERAMLNLGHYLGRQNAHDVIYDGSMKAFEEDRRIAVSPVRLTGRHWRNCWSLQIMRAAARPLWTVPWNDGEMWGNL